MNNHAAANARDYISNPRTRRSAQQLSDAFIAGSLFSDLDAVTKELYQALQRTDITVWMNANADILYRAAGETPDVSSDWIAGTYGLGAGPADIAADLQLLRAERRAIGLLDD